MKKMWKKPEAIVEQFAANEYVAACWNIKCLVPTDPELNGYDGFGDDMGGHQTRNGACGNYGAMYVQEAGGDNYKLTEFHYNWGELPCTIYPGGIDFENKVVNGTGSSTIKITTDMLNDDGTFRVYWTTQYGNNKYYHYGDVHLSGTTVQHS